MQTRRSSAAARRYWRAYRIRAAVDNTIGLVAPALLDGAPNIEAALLDFSIPKPFDIVVVDGRGADARLIAHHLTLFPDAECRVTICTCLRQALEQLQTTTPDAILAEISLPDASGLAVVEQLHRAAPLTPLVLLTGNADTRLAIKAMAAGAQDFLVKGEVETQALGRILLQAAARQHGLAHPTERGFNRSEDNGKKYAFDSH